ncbi:MAG TPA: menaquinone biosynthesis protein [Candidatus Acidoferrales bacterium]|nr:menaquinone biosynthesis protein [Candidatus Acidoferrales bacterium]
MVRVARLTYLNCAAFYWGSENWRVPLIPCVPRELGQLAARGEIDAGPMAVADWFRLESEFEPVGPYGIASRGSVLSVLLFSARPIEDLASATIAVTEETSTSFQLLRLLLERRYRLSGCNYRRGDSGHARLLIGDAALEEMKKASWPFVYDLAAEWQRWQGSPFVFARWVIRRSLPGPEKARFEKLLDESFRLAMERLDEVAHHFSGQGSLDKDEIVAYLRNLVFIIGADEERGLAEFRRLLAAKPQRARLAADMPRT